MIDREIKIEVLNNTVFLDRECWSCDGGREDPDPSFLDEDGKCESCKGTGFAPTETGKEILYFIKRHIK